MLRLIRDEGSDLVVHAGDFDYENDPEAWESMLTEELGADFPYLASAGGHDLERWPGYEQVLLNRARRVDDLEWTGSLGLQATCTFRGITVVLAAPNFCEDQQEIEVTPAPCEKLVDLPDREECVNEQLANADTQWRFCSFHEPHEDFQVSDKGSGAPIELYDACRRNGAIITTGDDHNYARTRLIDDYEARSVVSQSLPYEIGNGRTFSVVSGNGGESFYEATERKNSRWWAATNTADGEGTIGAFFATLRPDGTGTCYFKDINDAVLDGPFDIRRTL